MVEGEVGEPQVTETSAIPADAESAPATSNLLGDREEWNEEDEDYDNYDEDGEGEDDDDADADAEAEEIARRLRDQLWADINAARATANAQPAQAPLPSNAATLPTNVPQTISKKEEEALVTMTTILAFANKDVLVRNTLATAVIPDSNGDNVLDLLTRSVTSRTIPKVLAKPLSNLLVTLVRSDTLFATLRHSNAPALHLDKGKRKRDEVDDSQLQEEEPASKRVFYGQPDLLARVTDAVRIVTQTLGVHSVVSPLDPSVVDSIQLQLHQIFLFAVTSSSNGGTEMNPLQEISGLIQVIGVLSGIQIGPIADPHNETAPKDQPSKTTPGASSNSIVPSIPKGDIGTAVYPCTTCRKIFSRLFSLRAHQRVHGSDRSYQCTICSVNFVRSHDLKRHAKLHEKTTWRCTGCGKSFSRRDAITRHKNSSRNRGFEGEACVNGGIVEVELDEGAEKLVRERQGKFSGDAIANQTSGATGYGAAGAVPSSEPEGPLEEGEVQQDIIARVQEVVMSLHGLLSTHVGATLGAPSATDGASVPMTEDPAAGQATLASVIARAQSQSLPARVQGSATGGEPDPTPYDAGARENETGPGWGETPTLQSGVSPSQVADRPASAGMPSLSMYGLSNDQALLLEQAIANAASAAQAQAEAEAALEEEEEDYDDGVPDNGQDDNNTDVQKS